MFFRNLFEGEFCIFCKLFTKHSIMNNMSIKMYIEISIYFTFLKISKF